VRTEDVHEFIESKRPEIEVLCRALEVRRLDLSGSATGATFDVATSDVDVLVEFDIRPGFDCFGAFFSLKEGLEEIFGRPVDLISSSSVRNPYFHRSLMATKDTLYAA
jgi:uncharacterized protein